MSHSYYELTRLIERLHRRFLDVLRADLDRLEVVDLNPVQCLMLCNIGQEVINVRNLMDRGYYLGSNASYNIKKLVESGYLLQERSPHDRRATVLRLAPKALELTARIIALQERHAAAVAEAGGQVGLDAAVLMLKRLERTWEDAILERV